MNHLDRQIRREQTITALFVFQTIFITAAVVSSLYFHREAVRQNHATILRNQADIEAKLDALLTGPDARPDDPKSPTPAP